jgi:transcription elongation factor Elf1
VLTSACQLLVFDANQLTDANTDECRGIQYQGVTLNCCPPPAAEFCNLCEDGTALSEPDRVISDLTCAQVGGLAAFARDVGGATCTDYRATYGIYCGCDNPMADATACRICGGTSSSSNLLVRKEVFARHLGGPRTCGLIEYYAQYTTTERLLSCEAYQAVFADDCCEAPQQQQEQEPQTDDDDDDEDDDARSNVPVVAPPTNTTKAPTIAVVVAVPTNAPIQPPFFPISLTGGTPSPSAAVAGNSTTIDGPPDVNATTANVTTVAPPPPTASPVAATAVMAGSASSSALATRTSTFGAAIFSGSSVGVWMMMMMMMAMIS